MKKLRFVLVCCILLLLFQLQQANAGEINGLVVKSDETKIIENQKLIIDGDVVLEPNSTLIIRNSDVTINSHYKNQYWIYVNSGSLLLIEDSIIRDGPVPNLAEAGKFGKIENFRLGETVIQPQGANATVILRNSASEPRIGPDKNSTVILESSYISILFWRSLPSVRTYVTNSQVEMMHIWLHGDKKETITLSDLRPGESQDFNLSVEDSFLDVKNSKILSYSVALWSPYPYSDCRKDVVIENSELEEIFAVFPKGSIIRLKNMKPGYFEKWNIYQDMEGTGIPWNLTLKKVLLNKWKLDFHGTAEIENSVFHLDSWDKANIVVKNSKIVSNHHTRGGRIKFINSVISDRPGRYTGIRFLYDTHARPEDYQPVYIYEFENSTIGPYAEISITDDRINLQFKGNLSMKISPDKVHWFGGTITREYNVIVFDENQKPLANQTLILFDSEGKQIWKRSTDKNGLLYFNLTFNKNNYKKELLLQTMVDNSTITKKVNFFTETPILLFKKKIVKVLEIWQIMLFATTVMAIIIWIVRKFAK